MDTRSHGAVAPRANPIAARVRTLVLVSAGTVCIGGMPLACGRDDGPTAPGSGPGIVSGSVTSVKTSAGVPGLVVALIRDGVVRRATPTDSVGAFEFRDLQAGSYVVRLTGFELAGIRLRYTAFTPSEQAIEVGASPVQLFIAAVGLIPPRIVGTVRCDGVPAAGARVRVIGGETDAVVATSDQGKYGATDLAAGHYAVMVESAPCRVDPMYRGVVLESGQAATVDFEG